MRWKRLVHEGRACERCAGTEHEIARAMARLDSELRPWGLRPVLQTEAIDEAALAAARALSGRGDGMREHAVGNRGGVGEAQRERP